MGQFTHTGFACPGVSRGALRLWHASVVLLCGSGDCSDGMAKKPATSPTSIAAASTCAVGVHREHEARVYRVIP